ncbi:ABC transporter ATP-binding protein [Cohnella hongkongensis]|uniref:ABC transporter ATP-binding protein n=1 Tax=Cohnella hongkongensis TaxID=178337 RepID=A0ABV9FIR9_9BACL
MQELLRVYAYAKQYRNQMYKAIICLTISVTLSIVPFYIISEMIMRFTDEGSVTISDLAMMGSMMFIALVLRTYTHNKGLSASHHLAYDTLMGMRKRTADKLRRMPMGAIQRQSAGSLKKNFVENIEDMEIILAHSVPEGISNLLTVLVVTCTLFLLDWRLALLSLGTLPIGITAISMMMKNGKKRIGPYYQAAKEMNDTIIEYISGIEVIKVFNQTATSFRKYTSSVEHYKRTALDWYRVSWRFMTVYTIVLPSTLLFLLPVGTILFKNGSLSLGTFVLCILLALSMGLPLMRLVELVPELPNLRVKAKKIEQLFDEPEMLDGTIHKAPPNHSIVFRDVSFGYADHNVIEKLTFTAEENQVTALIGESGAGKTTIAKLLVRFWDVKSGEITIGGIPVQHLTFEALMNAISYVSQDVFLFNTTIMENIRMGKPNASDEEVIQMAKYAQCHDFIMESEHGYQTLVGEAGDKLSGGQRQRISIARAMLKNAPIVVLDEATSATDPENEDKIQEALIPLIEGKTLLVIAHRLSTIVEADKIILMDKGKMAAQGTHEALLSSSPLYKQMWQSHMEAMNWDITVKERSELHA